MKKKGITRPCPDGGVKTLRGINPAVVLSALGSKIYYGQVKVGELAYLLRVCDDYINQDMT